MALSIQVHVFLFHLIILCLCFWPGGLYKGTQAPQGAAGSAYDAMSSAKIKIFSDGNTVVYFALTMIK